MQLSHLRHAVFRWIMPYLRHEPLVNINLAQKAWPIVSAFTSKRQHTDQIESVECGPDGYDDGSRVLDDYAKTSRAVVLKGYLSADSMDHWTFERIKGAAGNSEGMVRVGDYAAHAGEPEGVKMRVSDFVDNLCGHSPFPHKHRLADGMGPYLGNEKIPALVKDLPGPNFFSAPPDGHLLAGCRLPHCAALPSVQ